MALSKTYTKDPCALDSLVKSIQDNSQVLVALDLAGTSLFGDQLTVAFRADLDDWTVVDAIVTAHDGVPLPQNQAAPVVVTAPVTTNAGSPKNEHSMQACGSLKAKFTNSDQGFAITLSNKSQDGLTFNYNSDFPFTPRVGDYIFHADFCRRAWITAVDDVNHTVTMDAETVRPTLDEGTHHYAKGFWIDYDVPDWHNPMYLWGLTFTAENTHNGEDDFVELSIVDVNDFFKSDQFCQALFGVTAAEAPPILQSMGFEENGEYGHWTKYYDESWVWNVNKKTIYAPDGAPGELMSHLACRISYFTSKQDATATEIYLDYFFTAKS